jgi:hypothetical protein
VNKVRQQTQEKKDWFLGKELWLPNPGAERRLELSARVVTAPESLDLHSEH